MPSKRKSKKGNHMLCHYRTTSATLLGNHKHEHDKKACKETCCDNFHSNDDSLLAVTLPNIETNICVPY